MFLGAKMKVPISLTKHTEAQRQKNVTGTREASDRIQSPGAEINGFGVKKGRLRA